MTPAAALVRETAIGTDRIPSRSIAKIRAHDAKTTSSQSVAGILVMLATGVYVVQPNERAVIRRCGRALLDLAQPGIHLGFPYGIDQVTKLKVFEQKIVSVGQSASDRTLGRAAELIERIGAGTLDVRIGARYTLAEAAEAHRALEGRRTTGKVLVVP